VADNVDVEAWQDFKFELFFTQDELHFSYELKHKFIEYVIIKIVYVTDMSQMKACIKQMFGFNTAEVSTAEKLPPNNSFNAET
jgi:hypothetical protein